MLVPEMPGRACRPSPPLTPHPPLPFPLGPTAPSLLPRQGQDGRSNARTSVLPASTETPLWGSQPTPAWCPEPGPFLSLHRATSSPEPGNVGPNENLRMPKNPICGKTAARLAPQVSPRLTRASQTSLEGPASPMHLPSWQGDEAQRGAVSLHPAPGHTAAVHEANPALSPPSLSWPPIRTGCPCTTPPGLGPGPFLHGSGQHRGHSPNVL